MAVGLVRRLGRLHELIWRQANPPRSGKFHSYRRQIPGGMEKLRVRFEYRARAAHRIGGFPVSAILAESAVR
jgi:hypothetical protein